MDKRLQKRHKRQVARAKANVKLSEPDMRTPEQVKADREASRPKTGLMHDAKTSGTPRPSAGGHSMSRGGASKTDT